MFKKMTVRNKLFTVLSSFLMVFAVGTFAFAQETTTQDNNNKQDAPKAEKGFGHRGGPDGFKHGRHGSGKGFGHRGGGMRGGGFAKLNLTEDQKLQMKNLHDSFKAGNEASFKEMHTLFQQKHDQTITAEGEARLQALKSQMKSAHEGLRASMAGILTAEQKTQLETMKQERRQKMEERRKMRQSQPQAPAAPQTKDSSL
jgi:protein CpxP